MSRQLQELWRKFFGHKNMFKLFLQLLFHILHALRKNLKSYMLVKLQMHTKLHEEIRVKCLTLLKTSMSQQTLVKY